MRAFRGLHAVGVRNPLRDEQGLSGADPPLVSVDSDAQFAFQDVKRFVLGAVEMQGRRFTARRPLFEERDTIRSVAVGDADNHARSQEPKVVGVGGWCHRRVA